MAENQQSDETTAQNGAAPSAGVPPESSDQAMAQNGAPSEKK
ncbi:MAG TPA: hypothetical protein VN685_01490 [Rhizomicrobium sp.]|nr:hypothetical protein [Rhizomicrobium sp.]